VEPLVPDGGGAFGAVAVRRVRGLVVRGRQRACRPTCAGACLCRSSLRAGAAREVSRSGPAAVRGRTPTRPRTRRRAPGTSACPRAPAHAWRPGSRSAAEMRPSGGGGIVATASVTW